MRVNSIQFNNNLVYQKKFSKKVESFKETTYANSLECIANQNVAFCAKKPIYAMDKNKNLTYYDSTLRASIVLGITDSSISAVLKGRNHEAQGYTFAYASDIETIDEKGKKCLNFEAVEKLEENFDKAKTVPVYVIDYDGNIKKFESQTKAADFLDTTLKVLNKAVNNYSYVASDCVVVPASKIEKRDKNNKLILDSNFNPVLDYEKIKSELCKFSNSQFAPICTISYLGEITRYQNRQHLIETGQFAEGTISSSLNNGKPTGGVVIVFENEILKRDEHAKTLTDINGNYIYDLSEINKRLQVFADSKSKPIKAKNVRTKETTCFLNASQAAQVLGISKQMISKCLKGEFPFNGYLFQYLYPMYLDSYHVIEHPVK